MNTGEIIKNARIRQGLSLRELAKKLGISYSAIHHWEKNSRKPNYIDFVKLIDFLKIEEEIFIKEDYKEYESNSGTEIGKNEKILSTRIVFLRIFFSLSQLEFANKLKLNQQLVSNWESGKVLISTSHIFLICEVFEIDIKFFDVKLKDWEAIKILEEKIKFDIKA